jgi:hypothetical protein
MVNTTYDYGSEIRVGQDLVSSLPRDTLCWTGNVILERV